MDQLREQRPDDPHHRRAGWFVDDTTLKAAETGYVKITKPGPSRYACKEHPWAVGELIVPVDGAPQWSGSRLMHILSME